MTDTLEEFLLKKEYIKVKLYLTKTNHLEIKASLNGVKGRFILEHILKFGDGANLKPRIILLKELMLLKDL